MSGQDRIDTQFLKETVADVVVKKKPQTFLI